LLIEFWGLLIVFSLIILFLGYLFETTVSDVLLVIGWGFIFILGAIMTFGQINQVVGNSDIITYDYDASGKVNATYITSIDTYSSFGTETGENFLERIANKRVFGFFIMLLGMVGSITFWWDAKRKPIEYDGVDYT